MAAKRKGKKPGPKKLTQAEMALVVLDKARGVTPAETAERLRVHEHTINRCLQTFEPLFQELELADEYAKAKARILDAVQLKFLKSATSPEKIDAARHGELMKGVEIADKIARLERGQSTQNVAGKFEIKHLEGDIITDR